MKDCLKTFLLLILFFLAHPSIFAQNSLESLYKNKQYFDLRDELAKHSKENSPALLFYRGIIANRFNKLQQSDEFLQKYVASGNTIHLQDTYETLADNYVKTFEYAKAADVYKLLLDRFKNKLSLKEKKDYENSLGLWGSLRNAPKQEIAFDGDLDIQGTRDKADLLNLPVKINSQKMDFVFDTGANVSTMTISTANKLGLKIIESSFSVGSSSNIRVNSKLAVVPILKLGSVTLHNVVFLVFDDKSLFFPQIDYQIDGIIGLPAIESLGSVTITNTNKVLAKTTGGEINEASNLCLDELEPLVAGTVNNKKMIFAFDSGASTSTFYPPFFKANQSQILKFAKTRKTKLGGAGGFKEVTAYYLDNLNLNIGGKIAKIANAEIITEPVNEGSSIFYGNLGQDLIKQFKQMTLDFRAMRLTFE